MRILLAHNSLYYPSHGGGDISNRLLMEALAARGHACRVVARLASFGPAAHERFLADLKERPVTVESAESGVVVFRHAGVEVHVLTAQASPRGYFAQQVGEFSPSVILTTTRHSFFWKPHCEPKAPASFILCAPRSPCRLVPTQLSRARVKLTCSVAPMALSE